MDQAGFDRLLRRARRRDPEALHKLVDLYSARLYGLLYRLTSSRETAEDLMQETFLRLVRTIGDYQHQGKFESWLFRIAANLARDHARRRKRRGQTATIDCSTGAKDSGSFDLADPRQPDPVRESEQSEMEQRLSESLQGLSEIDREIILLRHFSDLPFREIADMLNIPLGTALARAHRAMKHLRGALADGT